jgi:lysophospholipase L1-like esterase
VTLKPVWDSFTLRLPTTSGDSHARIFFDLGGGASRVELKDVALLDSSRTRIEPQLGKIEYFVHYRFNALGFRGPDYAVPRPPDTFRILALGDSYTQGVGVHERDTFTVQLERILNAAPAQPRPLKYEVINAGITGYDTRAERITYERIASVYEPQVVLLMMVFNDDMSFQEETRRGLLPQASGGGFASNLRSRIDSATQSDRPYDYSASIAEVRKLNDLCRARGAKLAVAIFRNTRWFAPWKKLLKDVREGLAGTDIPLLDLGEILLTEGLRETALVVHAVDGHPNELAHRLTAAGMEKFLRTHRMLP